ncbi:aminoglycoside phosphotransferase family protein [Natronolimnobius sp. AArcel1]|nr:aminoglycoside phosphotransferase family protein [Natronolimnobius sp. AArcel1]
MLERIVEAALEAEVQSVRRPRAGSVADTFLLELSPSDDLPARIVCKRGGASVWTGDVIEPLVCERVRAVTDLPVPAVLAQGSLVGGDQQAATPERWALYEHLEGETPTTTGPLEPAVRCRLVAAAGARLGQLHSVSLAAFGLENGAESTGNTNASTNATSVSVGGLARGPDGDLEVCTPDGWHAIEARESAALYDRLSVPLAGDPDCVPVLTHGDYQPRNLLIASDGSITGILDWGNAHVTHATYALARAEVRFVDLEWIAGRLEPGERDRLRRLFRDGYASKGPLERTTELERQLRRYKWLWVCQSLANYGQIARSARGRTQLWRQCRRLLE